MAIAVAQVGGNVTTGGGPLSSTFGSSTTSGSGIGAVSHDYNTGGARAAGDVTDNKSNTFQLAGGSTTGANLPGVAGHYNTISSASRGASHQITTNSPGAGESLNLAIIEFTGQDSTTSTSAFDSASFATASDGTSPWDVTAAAAVPSGAMGVYGVTIDTGSNNAFTQPSGYTNIINQPDGVTSLVSCASYKLSETGTPTVGASSSHTGAAREIFMAFKAAGAAATKAFPFKPAGRKRNLMRRF